MNKFMRSLASTFKKVTAAFSENQKLKVEEYALEHLLIYHGMVGSKPDNERRFADVKADIEAAIKYKSTNGLSIALKLPPLWWEERLKSIFLQLPAEDKLEAIFLLQGLDKNGQESKHRDSSAIRNVEWHVRANCANVLSWLQDELPNKEQTVSLLLSSLDDTTDGDKAAFPHISFALAKIENSYANGSMVSPGLSSLKDYLYNEEPWLRVDAARAIALYDEKAKAPLLLPALLAEQPMWDYMALVTARALKVKNYINSADPVMRLGSARTVLGVLTASEQTFSADIVKETEVMGALVPLLTEAVEHPNSLTYLVLLKSKEWLGDHQDLVLDELSDLAVHTSEIEKLIENERTNKMVLRELEDGVNQLGSLSASKLSETKTNNVLDEDEWAKNVKLSGAVQLAGALRLKQAVPYLLQLLPLLKGKSLENLLESFYLIGADGSNNTVAAQSLIKMANSLVDIEERRANPASKKPVFEEDAEQATCYWLALKALGSFPCREAVEFLLACSNDYAPDKRAQAYSSLGNIAKCDAKLFNGIIDGYQTRLELGLGDASPEVQRAALEGVINFPSDKLINHATSLVGIKEGAVSRQAVATLQAVFATSQAASVKSSVEARLKGELNPDKREILSALAATLKA